MRVVFMYIDSGAACISLRMSTLYRGGEGDVIQRVSSVPRLLAEIVGRRL